MHKWADWKPTNKNKSLMEIETVTCTWCFKTARENVIRTSQNEKETLLEEIKGNFVTWFLSLHPWCPLKKISFLISSDKTRFFEKKKNKIRVASECWMFYRSRLVPDMTRCLSDILIPFPNLNDLNSHGVWYLDDNDDKVQYWP